MSISRLAGLSVAQGLEKAQIAYKKGALKRLDGSIMKATNEAVKGFSETANPKLKSIMNKKEGLENHIKALNESRSSRNDRIQVEKQNIFNTIRETPESVAKTAVKMQLKANPVKHKKMMKDLKEIEDHIEVTDLSIKQVQMAAGNEKRAYALKEGKRDLLALKFKLKSNEYQAISFLRENQQQKMKKLEASKNSSNPVNTQKLATAQANIANFDKQLESLEQSFKNQAYDEVYPGVRKPTEDIE